MNEIAARRPASAPIVRAIGDEALRIEDVVALATGVATPQLSASALERMRESAALLAKLHAEGADIYGVTTSVGASVEIDVPPDQASALSLYVMRMHGCGTGQLLSDDEAAATLVVRAASLANGKSGVRPLLAERLIELLTHRALPCIPEEGSVGASGDLTPLSYVVATLAGEREIRLDGEILDAPEALAQLGLAPIQLEPKEALALMNGTAVATGIAALGIARAERLARLACAVTALSSHAIRGNRSHFDAAIHAAKPHVGQQEAARLIREALEGTPAAEPPQRLQDRYSIRCAPHVIGVLFDTLAHARAAVETELNGVSDNPIVDVESGRVLHGGNFYGGHIAQACDSLKVAVANVASLLDRQILLLCNPAESDGLPRDLAGMSGPEACAHNGFKAVTIATSSLSAEALKLCVPASIFSRSTELHNQDQVPMATIAARDLRRVLDLAERVLAMVLLAACQGADQRGGLNPGAASAVRDAVRTLIPPITEDRRMDRDIAALVDAFHADRIVLEGV